MWTTIYVKCTDNARKSHGKRFLFLSLYTFRLSERHANSTECNGQQQQQQQRSGNSASSADAAKPDGEPHVDNGNAATRKPTQWTESSGTASATNSVKR